MSKKSYLTSNEVATLLRVTPVTVRQWSRKGMLAAEYTPGGHRRFLIHEIERFAAEHDISLSGSSSRTLEVLVVESDEQTCTVLVDKLSALAHEMGRDINVETASNCFEAGAKAFSYRPKYILLDLDMTGIEGCSVCNVLHSISKSKDVQVLTMASSAPNDVSDQDLTCVTSEDCLIKPVPDEALVTALGLDRPEPIQIY